MRKGIFSYTPDNYNTMSILYTGIVYYQHGYECFHLNLTADINVWFNYNVHKMILLQIDYKNKFCLTFSYQADTLSGIYNVLNMINL